MLVSEAGGSAIANDSPILVMGTIARGARPRPQDCEDELLSFARTDLEL